MSQKKRLLLLCAVFSFSVLAAYAQPSGEKVAEKKNLRDTILGRRTLLLPDPFDAQAALSRLFPGKFYDLSTREYTNRFINWECKGCKKVVYPDINDVEESAPWPYQDGVATRLLKVLDFADATGKQYKLVSFNHSVYDADGATTGRFTGGLLGMAKFNRTDSGWRLQAFQPAIGAYGAFASCPAPKPVEIGEDQYAFLIEHFNGGAGGPFNQHDFLIAGVGGAYRQILAAYNMGLTKGEDSTCDWTSTYSVVPGGKKYFRNIVITCQGRYWAEDKEGLPEELKDKVKGKEHGTFTLVHVYEYSVQKGYQEKLPASVSVVAK